MIPLVDIPGQPRELGRLEDSRKAPLPLEAVKISARVIDRVAEVTVEQKFHNPFSEPIEAVYVFPLGGGSAVSAVELQVGARKLQARIEERGEARRQYDEALAKGKRAALLEQERDDVFTLQVGNVTPGDAVTIRLTYSEKLPWFDDGKTELRLPLVVAPRFIAGEESYTDPAGHGTSPDTTKVPDASRITPPRLVPGFDPKVSLQISAELFGTMQDLDCSQHAVSTKAGPESVRVELSREQEPLNRDFVLRWRLAGEKVRSQLLVHGGYAMISLVPPAREGYLGAPRDVVFVVDRSGSMQGPKMASAARACAMLLRTLSPRDRFAALSFDDVVEQMPGGFQQADEGGIARGEQWLRSVFARGGTQLDSAMAEALSLSGGANEGRIPVVVLLTDGQVGDESSVLSRLQRELGGARVFTVGIDTAVNDGFLKRLAALGGGTSSFVEPGARLEEALQAVAREIGTPLVTDLRTSSGERLPDLFAGRASIAFLRGVEGSITVTGSNGFRETLQPREAPLAAIDHLWARARIADLEDEFRATRSDKARKEIVALSLQHTVLTRFTAFVVIDPEVVNASGQRRTVVQPVEEPAEWAPQQMTMGVGQMRPMAAAPAGMIMGGGPIRAAMKAALAAPPLQKRPETASKDDRVAVRKALEAFVEAWKSREFAALEKARMELLKALSEALVIATAVPLLQAFLRGAAVEVIAALKAGTALFDKHQPAMQAAVDEARKVVGKKRFWEASI